ncbi:MAG TPA: DUF1835 domain-containing protein [Burkholderiales bacterium]|nr:DUF1835 domain-containing protein [Burkholderiales bacterium]
MLHVTNGDIAAGRLSRVFAGDVLPWRDVLHEGPVRAGLSLAELSEERARFIADAGWGQLADLRKHFVDRDKAIRGGADHDEVVLWFEHDLTDQLQLLQLLDWFHAHPHPRLSLVCEAQYVSHMGPARMRELFASRRSVPREMLKEGRDAWAAFRSPDPSRIPTATAMPFLGAALRRQLQEFPWTTDGLSLLERRILEALSSGPVEFATLFERTREDPAYFGDTVLRWHLERMAGEGLVARRDGSWVLKSRRRERRIPRWLGGVLVDEHSPWRWDPAAEKIGV